MYGYTSDLEIMTVGFNRFITLVVAKCAKGEHRQNAAECEVHHRWDGGSNPRGLRLNVMLTAVLLAQVKRLVRNSCQDWSTS